VLVDTNLLLYSADTASRHYGRAREWLLAQLNGAHRIGLPWQSLAGFLRIATHPRIFANPLAPDLAWRQVEIWLSAPAAWIPAPGPAHAELLGSLFARYEITGNLVPDAMLAALALEHGLPVCSADTDFARFAPEGLRWENPLV
jgi:uncharacterized protein